MKSTTKDGVFVLIVLILAIIIVTVQLKFAVPARTIEKCRTDVNEQYETEARLVLRNDLSKWSGYELKKNIEKRWQESLLKCEEFYGGGK